MQVYDRVAGDGPGQLLLPFGQFTFRVKGAKRPPSRSIKQFFKLYKFEKLDGQRGKKTFLTR